MLPSDDDNLWQVDGINDVDCCKDILELVDGDDEVVHSRCKDGARPR